MGQTNGKKQYGGLDIFRVFAAFLIVAIHTGPFSGISQTAEQYVTYGVCRIAVPFFFLVTGFFVLGKNGGVQRMQKHLLWMYLLISLLYLPVEIYSGNLPDSPGDVLKQIFFDGTFYHLWYLPAVILGLGVAGWLKKRLGVQWAGMLAAVLYLIGIFGDSYYGAAAEIAPLQAFYQVVFAVSSYTRNGIFFAPVFLILGAALASHETVLTKMGSLIGFLLSLSAMLAEVYLTTSMEWQRHNSMYLFLPLAAFFLFEFLRRLPLREYPLCRRISMWIYLLHPLCIIFVRAAAGLLQRKEWLTEKTLIFYLLVCACSLVAALVANALRHVGQEILKPGRGRRKSDGRRGKEQSMD